MKLKKYFIFLLPVLLLACTQKNKEQIVGKWKYERMVVGDLKTGADTLAQVISELMYLGSVLEFYKNDSFVMINRDTASEFQGRGTYNFNGTENTLTLQGGIKATDEDRMKVEVKELSADSLKLGNVKELLIYSRVK